MTCTKHTATVPAPDDPRYDIFLPVSRLFNPPALAVLGAANSLLSDFIFQFRLAGFFIPLLIYTELIVKLKHKNEIQTNVISLKKFDFTERKEVESYENHRIIINKFGASRGIERLICDV